MIAADRPAGERRGPFGRLLARLDIDGRQLRALFVAGLRLDFRAPAALQHNTSGASRWVPQFLMYLMVGLALAALTWFVPDVFLSGSLVVTVAMFFVAAALLTEFGVVVISPLDYDVLGYQPVSSRTYFAARAANVLFFVCLIGTVIGLPAVLTYLVARGFNPVLGLAAVLALYGSILTTALSVIVLYVGVARMVHPQRLKRALAYVQLVASTAVYGGYFLLPNIFSVSQMKTWSVRKSAWMLLYPPTWFASFLDIAAGRWSAFEVVPAAAAIAALFLLARATAGRISLDYSDLLSRQASATERVHRRRSRTGWTWGLGTGERRAVGLLLRAQFRHDQRFRMMVLSIVPLTILYIVLGVRDGGLGDPFVDPGRSNAFLLYFAMVMFPAMLMTGIGRSDSYRAAWVYFVTPARRTDLVLAVKDLALAYFLIPYMLAVTAALAYLFGSLRHAVLHMILEGLVVNLLLLFVVAVQPDLPFSKPVQKGRASSWLFVVMVVGAVVQSASTILLSLVVYPHPVVHVVVFAVLLAASFGGQRLLRRRLERAMDAEEFAA